MRALSACLTVVLGLGVAGMGACSSTSSDDSASAGSAGESTGGTSSGGTSSGGTSSGGTSSGGTSSGGTSAAGAPGDIGVGGAAECGFVSDACTACLSRPPCATPFAACVEDNACSASLSALQPCLCNSSSSAAECETTFIADGAKQKALADCFDANCNSDCE